MTNGVPYSRWGVVVDVFRFFFGSNWHETFQHMWSKVEILNFRFFAISTQSQTISREQSETYYCTVQFSALSARTRISASNARLPPHVRRNWTNSGTCFPRTGTSWTLVRKYQKIGSSRTTYKDQERLQNVKKLSSTNFIPTFNSLANNPDHRGKKLLK